MASAVRSALVHSAVVKTRETADFPAAISSPSDSFVPAATVTVPPAAAAATVTGSRWSAVATWGGGVSQRGRRPWLSSVTFASTVTVTSAAAAATVSAPAIARRVPLTARASTWPALDQ